MPIPEKSLAKLTAIGSARPLAPLPEIPKLVLSDAFKARFPEDAENIERYNEHWARVFKELPFRRV